MCYVASPCLTTNNKVTLPSFIWTNLHFWPIFANNYSYWMFAEPLNVALKLADL